MARLKISHYFFTCFFILYFFTFLSQNILQKGHKFLKYITIVKCGLPEEAATSAKPGNRGKRDSQLVVMGYYNRIHYGRELTELDSAIQRAMVDLNLQADMVRFLSKLRKLLCVFNRL